MERRPDELSFEGAWSKQVAEEKDAPKQKEAKEVKVHEGPAFRGQRDIVEQRSEIRMATKQKPVIESKKVEVVAEASSKEGDDFDVEW